MKLPLISHPAQSDSDRQYPIDQTTDTGHLLLTAHSTCVSERATTLYTGSVDQTRWLWVAATLHDFGKATPQFQEYVRPDEEYTGDDKEKNHARLGALATWFVLDRTDAPSRDCLAAMLAVARHHQALPNAAEYTANTLIEAFDDSAIKAQINAIETTWPSAADEFFSMARQRIDASETISWEAFYEWATSGEIVVTLQELSTEAELTSRRCSTANLPEELYDRTLHYWASLTLADKSHAMTISDSKLFRFDTLDLSTLEQYIAELRETPPDDNHEAALNDERERARRQAIQGVHGWLDNGDSSVATLTLPTGLGKTFTGLSAGFETRDILDANQERDRPRTVIYALPYTSIIEQTRELFEDPDLWGVDPRRSALTVHHYLSETIVAHGDHDDSDVDATDADQAGLLGESWRDGTILTTFVQLFESLTGPSNSQGLKLPALDSGVVILDEPQALPKEWWDAIPRLLSILTDEFNTHVISMTATQPSLFRELNTVPLLASGRTHNASECKACCRRPVYETELPPATEEDYFDQAERVQYTLDTTALAHQVDSGTGFVSYEAATARIIDHTQTGESTLAVCNTIASSAALTETICENEPATHLGTAVREHLIKNNISAIDPDQSPKQIAYDILASQGLIPPVVESDSWSTPKEDPLFVLTFNSRYRPFDRRILINILTFLSTAPVQFVCVSTQAIEAGVDVSFNTVFRDIAPIDSIVQAAGRCNRSYEWGKNGGQVIVWTLADPDEETPADPTEKPPAEYVYERGTQDTGVHGHLRLISDVLAGVDETEQIPDVKISLHAVEAYFESIHTTKSVANTDIREHIETAKARWLSRQSLIGGYETVDVLVAVTESDKSSLQAITEAFNIRDTFGFKKLDEASQLRVSLPVRKIEDAPKIPRIDHRDRGEEGAQVFEYSGGGGLKYGLDSGGLKGVEDTVSGRFSL